MHLYFIRNTFSDTASFLPKPEIYPKNCIIFPSCLVHHVVYQTILLKNDGENPMPFEFELGEVYPIFQCKPMFGMVPKRSFQLITFKFSPLENKRYSGTARCILNENNNSMLEINLFGIGAHPTIKFERKLYFHPTHIGALTSKEFEIHNPSRVSAVYEWEIPMEYSKIFAVEPLSGVLRGNERKTIKWLFAPAKVEHYIVKINCKITSLPATKKKAVFKVPLTLIGEGTSGGVSIEPKCVNFETVLIGASARRTFTILNSSDCAVPYEIVVAEEHDGGKLENPLLILL